MASISDIRRYYLFHGPDESLKWKRIKGLISAVITPGFESFDSAFFNARGVDMTAVINNASSPPMGSALRVTVLRDIDKLTPKAQELLERFIKQIPNYSCLVLTCEKIDRRKKLYKTLLDDRKSCVEFREMTPQKAAELAITLAEEAKAELSRENALYLVETIGTDYGRIHQEIDKLTTYVGVGEPIGREAIAQMCGGNISGTATDLPEKLASGDVAGALKILEQLLLAKESEGGILYRLKDFFLKVNLAKLSNMTPEAMARALGYGDSFAFFAERLIKISRGISQEAVADCLLAIYECEISLKSGRISKDLLLRQLLCQIGQLLKPGNK